MSTAHRHSDAARWYLRRRESARFLRSVPKMDPILARVLYARKIDTPERIRAFLRAEDEPADPFQMAGMTGAVSRIVEALDKGERIAVYGDFDADGVCATALLQSALEMAGANVFSYIPDRFSEAYGLNVPALEKLRAQGTRLVVTVDCGIRSVAEVAHAQGLGLDLVITDHHSVPAELPPALAVIDPKRADSAYPFKGLAGVGVAYRLAQALFSARLPARPSEGAQPDLHQYLDLVALGTVADIVPLTGENRTLVRRGLKRIAESPRPGLRALMQVAGVRPEDLDSQAIAFRLAPRINAAGRLKSAKLALDLLLSTAEEQAQGLAAELNAINQERQQILERQVEEARELLGALDERRLLFVEGPTFHEGIVGLVASRLSEEFYRPALVMRRGEATTRGSARSIEGFHITHALDACGDLLTRHGGHARAAGFTLPTPNLPALRQRLEEYGAGHLSEETLRRRRSADAIISLDQINGDTLTALSRLEPCGEGNPEPALATLGLEVLEIAAWGRDEKHLRLRVREGSRAISAIAFRQGHLAAQYAVGDVVDLIYRPTMRRWQGETILELEVKAVRRSGGST